MNITELTILIKENSKLNLGIEVSDKDGNEKLYIYTYPPELKQYYGGKSPLTVATIDMDSVGMLDTSHRGMYELEYDDMHWLFPILTKFALTNLIDREDPEVFIVEITKIDRLDPKEKPKGTLVYKRGDGTIDSDFQYYNHPVELISKPDFLFTVNELIELGRKDLIPLIKPLSLRKSEVVKIRQERSAK